MQEAAIKPPSKTLLMMELRAIPELFGFSMSWPTLATISCPTAVICGKEDLLCPVDAHKLMAREIPGATLTVIDDCGHIATLERPDAVTRALQNLFQQ